MAVTTSTMPYINANSTFSHFKPPKRNQPRLNSTVRFRTQVPSNISTKFTSLPLAVKRTSMRDDINWNKWKAQ